MIILGIETSCDDTCVAVLQIKNGGFEVLSNVVASQIEIHKKWGGVYPSLAKREHQKILPIVLKRAEKEAENPKIDLIAVTIGPGLEPCLWTGVNFAKELSEKLKKPLIPVNHVEAHIIANFINLKSIFPAVCLVVSGGHTQLILMEGLGKYKILGETRDDAAGECFDKVARILGLGYPGGPIIAKLAAKLKIKNLKFKITLPRPMIKHKNYDFSFSGLKTAVLYLVKQLTTNNKQLTINQKREICAEVQRAIIDVLIYKTLKAAKNYKAKSIILGGGVAANDELRKQFQSTINNQELTIKFLVPPKNLCTDNAVMVAATAYFNWRKRKSKKEDIEADANLTLPIVSRA